MKTIRNILFFAGVLISSLAFGQDQQNLTFKDKLFFGGGFGAGFGDYTYVSVTPIIGYKVSPRLSIGVQLTYQYTTFKYDVYQARKEKTYQGNDFGIGGFARLSVYGPLYLQAEYEHLNYDGLYYDGTSSRTNFDSFMAGGGIAQPIGNKAFLFLTAMYNFSYQNFNSTNAYRSPYDSPWVIRIGVSSGF